MKERKEGKEGEEGSKWDEGEEGSKWDEGEEERKGDMERMLDEAEAAIEQLDSNRFVFISCYFLHFLSSVYRVLFL